MPHDGQYEVRFVINCATKVRIFGAASVRTMPTLVRLCLNNEQQLTIHQNKIHTSLTNTINMPTGHQFLVGDLVEVDKERRFTGQDSEGGRGFLCSVDVENATAKVRYVVDRHTSPRVAFNRMKKALIATVGRTNNNENADAITPSLMSLEPSARRLFQPLPTRANNISPRASTTKTTRDLVNEMNSYNARSATDHPVLEYMEVTGKRKGKGWLRQADAKLSGRQLAAPMKRPPHLSKEEKQLLLNLRNALRGTVRRYVDNPTFLLAEAWGVSKRTINNIDKQSMSSREMQTERKRRHDAGTSIFTSCKKMKATLSPFAVFLKTMRRESRGELLSHSSLKAQWTGMSNDDKEQYEHIAADLQQRGQHLADDVTVLLRKTRGSISWRRLATELSGGPGQIQIVSPKATMKYIMGLQGSKYVATTIRPLLNKCSRQRRFKWPISFWLFWNNAKLLAQKVQVLLVHMDEKWALGIVGRRNNKSVPALGVEPLNTTVHHKSHIPKVMVIATTGFLPHDNNMASGGVAIKVSLTRVGRMKKADKDSYRRVYKDDGSFHYPNLPENLLRKKGTEYFQSLDITGSSEGTDAKPKFSLLKFFLETEIPALESVVAALQAKEPSRRFVVRYQMDGAGPHQDRRLLDTLQQEFAERQWMMKFQPANSPLTNVKDACIFPAMSKRVSQEQSMLFGGRAMQQEEIWKTVVDTWETMPLETIARSYTAHHQVVNAIANCKGGDEFTKEHKALHFGIRQHCTPYYEGEATEASGVQVWDEILVDPDIADAVQATAFRYEKPDTSGYDVLEHLNEAESSFLYENLPRNSGNWQDIAAELMSRYMESEADDDLSHDELVF